MNTQQANLMEIFYIIDEFCKSFDQTITVLPIHRTELGQS